MANGDRTAPSRRTFMKVSAGLAAGGMAAGLPSFGLSATPVRRLAFKHMITGESVDVVYAENGHYLTHGCAEIDYFMRDWHTNDVVVMDRKLLDLIYVLHRKLGPNEPFEFLCGHRSRETNEQLRRTQKGVAKNSYHIPGMAIDLRLPNVSLKALRNEAQKMKVGGVGYYPRSGFVHVDTGDIRYW